MLADAANQAPWSCKAVSASLGSGVAAASPTGRQSSVKDLSRARCPMLRPRLPSLPEKAHAGWTRVTGWSEPVRVLIDRSRVRRFAAAIGEVDRRYFDVDVAHRMGHRDLPVPVSLPFTLESDEQDTLG